MKFSTRMDTDLTAAALFAAISDFDRLAQIIRRRRAQVKMLDPALTGSLAWDLAFDWRGRRREFRIALNRHDPDEALRLTGVSDLFDIVLDLQVVALTRARSRLICGADLRPRSMTARLVVQTAKLGKAQLDRRFAAEIAGMLAQLTEGHMVSAPAPAPASVPVPRPAAAPVPAAVPVPRLPRDQPSGGAPFCAARNGSAG